MNPINKNNSDYWFGLPAIPQMQPYWETQKLWELENDDSYLKYLYPNICNPIQKIIDDECDQLEYDGSFIFDSYPDKISLQQLAHKIYKACQTEFPDRFPSDDIHMLELIEILLYHEIIYRRNRYRNRKRLYF